LINKKKRYLLLFMLLPLTITALVSKVAVAILTFVYIRFIHEGIIAGSQLHKKLEFHEQGKVGRNKHI